MPTIGSGRKRNARNQGKSNKTGKSTGRISGSKKGRTVRLTTGGKFGESHEELAPLPPRFTDDKKATSFVDSALVLGEKRKLVLFKKLKSKRN